MLRSLAQILSVGVASGHGIPVSHVEYATSIPRQRSNVIPNRQAIGNVSIESAIPTGLQSAEQCAQNLASWHSASTSWSLLHNTSYVTMESYKQPAWATAVVPYYKASSLTTLCDGHPRVVGFADSSSSSTTLGTPQMFTTSVYPITEFIYNVPPYPLSQAPCTIEDSECQALYDRNSSLVYVSYNPICNIASTSTSTHTYATDSAGNVCSQCYIRASSARLLYWQVRTIDGSGDICGSSIQTEGLSRTGDGPNTFATDGITITSPSVGIFLASVSRADRCFTTLESTIVVVHASEVMSARGARALYDHEPFRYQDLNYKCQPANSSIHWIQDEPGDDCYQEVPAIAYFSGESAFNWDEYYPTAYGPPLTIGPDYRPYILPPESMTDWANSIYHTSGCLIQVNGVWDSPRALLPGTTILTPVPAWQTVASLTSAAISSAIPAEASHSQLAETSARQDISTATEATDDFGSVPTSTSSAELSGATTVLITSEIRSAKTIVPEQPSLNMAAEESPTTLVAGEQATRTNSSTPSNRSTMGAAATKLDERPTAAIPSAAGASTVQGSTIATVDISMPTTQASQSSNVLASTADTSNTHASYHGTSTPLSSASAVSTAVEYQG